MEQVDETADERAVLGRVSLGGAHAGAELGFGINRKFGGVTP